MNIRKTILCATATASAMLMASDTPEVSNVTMTQASFGRQVTITYELNNAPNGAVVTLDVETNAAGNVWASIGGEAVCNAQGAVWRKVTGADADGSGKYTITWRPDLSWEGHKIELANGGARAVVTAWALDNTPDYMVVDISATGGADKQTYYPGADFVPGGVANSLYKTTTFLMRKIMAKDVTWTMGSVAESGRTADREESHQVTLTNNYYIGVYEVTQTQWQQITGYNPSFFITEQMMRPVETVSYSDIRQGKGTASSVASATDGVYPGKPHDDSFLGILRNKTKIDFDLPSEAQWEFAARAGHGEGYWGDGSDIRINSGKDENLNRLGRYKVNGGYVGGSAEPAANCEVTNGTAIVGTYRPNAWGLYDMHGNVLEWCLDWYTDDIAAFNGAVNTTSGGSRVQRGGSWSNGTASSCRAAFRGRNAPTSRSGNNGGFRVICAAGLR